MANHSLRASITYRRSQLAAPTALMLAHRFPHTPHDSLRALLAQAGPFFGDGAHRDAFLFTNSGWTMTDEDAATMREKYQRAVDVVKLIGIEAVRNSVSAVSVGVPIIGTVGIPAIVVDEVIRRISGPLTDQLVEKIVTGLPGKYGRCGGMAFAGLDYFLIGQDVPGDTQQPASGPLRDYVWQRLLDSLDLNVTRFLEWTMQLHIMPVISKAASAAIGAAAGTLIGGPIGTAIGALVAGGEDILGLGGPKLLVGRTRDELNTLRYRLDTGPGWPIGLIYDDSALVWDQHQILAMRYRDLGGGRLELTVWNNNLGRMETVWTVDPTGEALQVSSSNDKDTHVKGIIADEYQPHIPPL